MYLLTSIALFALFAANVLMGSLNDAAFLNDVSEMLLLLCVSIFFVAAILKAERDSKKQ
ncbi:MAG: hypothetical protein ACPGSC_06185 [Granulosicoccaceae bacterium]